MTLKEFIRKNKEEIDQCICAAVPGTGLSNDERRLWVLNDEDLYKWARSEGVKI